VNDLHNFQEETMRRLTLLSLFALFFSALAHGGTLPCQGGAGSVSTFNLPCVFYGGDFDPNDPNANALANENDAIVGGDPYGAATYQNFVWSGGSTPILGLFTNNLSSLTPSSGYFEVRSGVSQGNGGTLIASGTETGANFLQTATGRSAFGYTEYTDAVRLSNPLTLANGTYWFAVVPVCTTCVGRSFNSNTDGLNSIGTQIPDEQYFNSQYFGDNFVNTQGQGDDIFSSGVLAGVPEPGTLWLLGTSLLGGLGVLHRKVF
jgi:hypothetical protein